MDIYNIPILVINIIECIVLVGGLIGSGAGLVAYIARKEFAKAGDMSKLEARLQEELNTFRVRMTTIEETLKHQPTIRDMERISERIGNIAIEVARIGATGSVQTDILRSIDQRLNKE